jgi:hypothetical protein
VEGDGGRGRGVGEMVAVARGETGTAAHCHWCFSPLPSVPLSSHHLLHLSMLRRWISQLSSSPPRVSSSHLRNMRETTPISSRGRATELSAPVCHLRWTCYSDEPARRQRIRAGDGLIKFEGSVHQQSSCYLSALPLRSSHLADRAHRRLL